MRAARALTLYRVRRSYERFTLLDVEIRPGARTRSGASAVAEASDRRDETYNAGRAATCRTHSARMSARLIASFCTPPSRLPPPRTGELVRFNAPLPEELQEFLDELK